MSIAFCSFCMFITITLKYLMCFTLTKFHYSKYNFITPTISLQWDFTVLCCPQFTVEYWQLHPVYKNHCTYPWHFGVARANAGSMFASYTLLTMEFPSSAITLRISGSHASSVSERTLLWWTPRLRWTPEHSKKRNAHNFQKKSVRYPCAGCWKTVVNSHALKSELQFCQKCWPLVYIQ